MLFYHRVPVLEKEILNEALKKIFKQFIENADNIKISKLNVFKNDLKNIPSYLQQTVINTLKYGEAVFYKVEYEEFSMIVVVGVYEKENKLYNLIVHEEPKCKDLE